MGYWIYLVCHRMLCYWPYCRLYNAKRKMKKTIIAIIIFILTIAGKLIIDLHLYYSGGVNNHIIGPAIVLISLGVCSWISGWRSIPMWLFTYWALFDSMYGIFIHQGFFYIGTTAKLDILQRHYLIILWMKYILSIASIVYYSITYNNKKHA